VQASNVYDVKLVSINNNKVYMLLIKVWSYNSCK